MKFLITIIIINIVLVLTEQVATFRLFGKRFSNTNTKWKFNFFTLLIFIFSLMLSEPIQAQPCVGSPSYNVNLSANNDSTWTSPSITRGGNCCATSNCVEFNITLSVNSTGIQLDIISGAIPGGALNYRVGCGPALSFGQPICLIGTGPFRITFCKPGGNSNIYQIKAIPKPKVQGLFAGSPACGIYIKAKGFETAGLTWTSIPSTTISNSYLSCRTNCDSVSIVPGPISYPLSLTYKVCGNVTGACASPSTCDTFNVILVDNPIVAITPRNPIICYGGGTTLALTANPTGGLAPYKYLWNTNDTSRVKTFGAGTYRVAMTDSLGCIVARDTSIITVNNLPFTANAGNDTTVCSSINTVNLRGRIQVATGGKWSGGTGKFIPYDTTLNAIYVPSLSEINAGIVKLILTTTGNNGCTPARDTVSITINQAPVPMITGSLNLCEYTLGIPYNTPAVAGNSYDWHVVGGTIAGGQGTANISVNWGNAGPGYIYMIQTAVSGCKGIGSLQTISRFDLNSNPITKATIGPDAISSDTDAYSNGFGYQITSNCGSSKGADITIPGSIFDRGKMCMTFSFQRDEAEADFFNRGGTRFYITGGKLSIQMRINNGAGGYADIGPLLTTYTVPNDDNFKYYTFCYDSASGVARVLVDDSIVWSYQAPLSRSLYWIGAGNAIMGTFMDGSCSGKTLMDFINIAIPVSIYPKPKPVISGPSPVCTYNYTYTYSVPSDPSASIYLWTISGGNILSGAGTNSVTVKWTVAGTGIISLKQTYTTTNCDTTISKSILINPSPVPVMSGYDSVCANKNYTYSVASITGNTYLWSISSGGTIIGSATLNTLTVKWGIAANRFLTLKQTNVFGCDSTITKDIIILAPPTPVITGNNLTCQNRIYTYNTLAVAGHTYLWTTTGGSFMGGNRGNTVQIKWGLSGSGTVLLTQSISTGCDSTVFESITIQPAPAPVINGADSSCENTLLTYSVNATAGHTFIWLANGGVIQGSTISNTVQVKWGLVGIGTLTVTQTSGSGCDSTIAKQIIKLARPVPVITGITIVCSGKQASYSIAGLTGSTYLWTVTGGNISGSNTASSITVLWSIAGTGTATIKQTNSLGCDSIVSVSVTIRPTPVPSINGTNTGCATVGNRFYVFSASGNTYSWTVSGGTIIGVSTDTACFITWGASGIGAVSIRQVNSFGCDSTVSKNVTINPTPVPVITGNSTPCSRKTHVYSVPFVASSTYQWSSAGGNIIGTSSTNLISLLWGAAGTGNVTVTQTNSYGCFASKIMTITILTLPGPSTLYHY